MSAIVIESKGIVWRHIGAVQEEDLAYLQANFRYHHLDYEDVRAQTPISKMDAYKHYVFLVFHIPTFDRQTERLSAQEVYVFLSKEGLVTLTHAPLPALEVFATRLSKNAKLRSSVLGKGTAFCLHQILSELFRESLAIVADLTREVRRLEAAIEQRHDKRLTVDLGHARRNILFLRHMIDPQRTMLSSLSGLRRSFILDDTSLYFDDVHDVLDTVWLTADNLKLTIDGLFDVNEALLSHRTNEVITLLTFVSATLMVPTLIAGFYGMNVPWLPFIADARVISFLYIGGFFGMILVVLAIIKRSRS